jgi:zinc protease
LHSKIKKNKSDRIDFIDYKLNNGLNIVLSEDNTIPSVAINLCYHAGSKDELPNKRGYAHLFEHLMFEGSKNLRAGDYDKISIFAGGENNAYTTEDKTNYYLLLPAHQLELGLWLESDRMLEFSVKEENLEIQKGVITEEKNQNCDNRPYGTVSIEFAPKLFKQSSYRWDTIGEMSEVINARIEDIKKFFDKYYIPNNAVLTIVGDIDIHETRFLIEKYFGEIKRGNDVIRPEFNELPLNEETRKTIYDKVQFPGIFIGYRIPKEFTKESFALETLSEILSSGESSRLYKELVYHKQLASEIGCYIDSKEFTGIFYVYCILMPKINVETAEKAINEIIEDVRNGNISSYEIEKAKNRIETKLTYRKQSILFKADILSHLKCFYNNPDLINRLLDNYTSITKEDIIEAAKEYLKRENRVVLIYMPKKN